MTANIEQQSICSVTELAKKLRLSRARFYQLHNTGVFPPPVYCLYTKRPFYPMDLQEKCLKIRKTGIGYNGRPIIFNSKRDCGSASPKNNMDPKYKELADLAPEEMTLCNVRWGELDLKGQPIPAGMGEKGLATQSRHVSLIEKCDRYLVL